MKKQFNNQKRMLESFGDQFLVICPNCSKQAKVLSLGEHQPYQIDVTKRFTCLQCGLTKDIVPKKNNFNQNKISYEKTFKDGFINIGGAFDWYFGYPLLLQIPFREHTFWAYNLKHLQYLKSYIEAELRENHPYYLSVESRLPLWMKSAKNRDLILKAIIKLELKTK
ncbi:hypothetical protein [Paenisporosarcina sp. OV554]|uniref:hypothetical protein n=1 Tax=Paenisporosarcina sp. OV554 TaxID=2135694 RepID=UPI000D375070|nr:hypothetical protein [Paenisporosarcina sp. OV554]PUB09449.1 hypothetical protein C8K15_1301 [Paenisporosarcina sp. OV554]